LVGIFGSRLTVKREFPPPDGTEGRSHRAENLPSLGVNNPSVDEGEDNGGVASV
jgi:hypothetical protein